ncbi:MAG: HU family DNA-binding protein [Candidatus Paceibacterota bacterium]
MALRKDELIKELAYKYNVTEEEVTQAVKTQFKFVKESTGKDTMPNIRLPYFGIFKLNKKKLKKLKELEHERRKNNR